MLQRQVEQKERENEELRRARIQDNKDISSMRKQLQEQANKMQVQNSETEKDQNEIEFYLTEMKEVKDRIMQSLVNGKHLLDP